MRVCNPQFRPRLQKIKNLKVDRESTHCTVDSRREVDEWATLYPNRIKVEATPPKRRLPGGKRRSRGALFKRQPETLPMSTTLDVEYGRRYPVRVSEYTGGGESFVGPERVQVDRSLLDAVVAEGSRRIGKPRTGISRRDRAVTVHPLPRNVRHLFGRSLVVR